VLVLPGSSVPKLGLDIATELKTELVAYEIRKFPDGEKYIKISTDVKDQKVVVVQSVFGNPDSLLFEYAMLVDAAYGAGASEIVGVFPYLAYLRQDERFKQGEALSSKVVASLIQSTRTSKVFVVDPHLHRIHDINELFDIPAFNVTAMFKMALFAKSEFKLKDPLVVAPDEEAEQWASKVASILGIEYLVAKKVRFGDEDVNIDIKDQNLKGRDILLVDDIISTGGTLSKISASLEKIGVNRIFALVTHGLFASGAYDRIKSSGIEEIVTTDTVPNKYSLVGIAPVIAKALQGD
jgi:ribose-phosphate pyrophosphokinase